MSSDPPRPCGDHADTGCDVPPWLSPDERAAWLALVAVTARLPAALDAQLRADAGLTLFDYNVLAILSEQPRRRLRMSDLAFVTNGSLSRLSHVASRLERAGLLVRSASREDPRYTEAVLTDAGYDRVVAAAPGHVTEVRRLVIDPLTDGDRAALRRIGAAIGRAVDQARPLPQPSRSGSADVGRADGDAGPVTETA